ncbi:v-type proton atpase subunit a [Anaeramoeba flamelloides]|uniref:V-type proton ATPase subunit a n=1 Tax=Anaeramoeba flamelloides TaxID=1746091 RepID=A0AAV7YCF5_9EUKA|nr:v-type proton atpase subunit a [Anaeramoeba flamelloides]
MSNYFRSERMKLIQLLIKPETAYSLIRAIGQLESIQFRDLNEGKPNILREFQNDVKRFDKLERRIRKFDSVTQSITIEESDEENLLQNEEIEAIEKGSIDNIEDEIMENITKLDDLVENEQQLKRRWFELIEFQHNLKILSRKIKEKDFSHSQRMIKLHSNSSSETTSNVSSSSSSATTSDILTSEDDLIKLESMSDEKTKEEIEKTQQVSRQTKGIIEQKKKVNKKPTKEHYLDVYNQYLKFNIVTGTILTESRGRIERLIWRGTKGNAYVSFWDIHDPIFNPIKKAHEHKTVFVVYYSGGFLQNRITKIVESFNAKVFNIGSTHKERKQQLEDVKLQLADLKTTIKQTNLYMKKFLKFLKLRILPWYRRIHIEKATYHTLNLFSRDTNEQYMVAEGWVRLSKLDKFRQVVQENDEIGEHAIIINILDHKQMGLMEPTYIKCKEYQKTVQSLVNSFFIPKYREINPAPIMLVTFPFFFAVMFSDLGHGILLTLFALFLFKTYDVYKVSHYHSLIQLFYNARHLILTMGISSCFIGIMYNEIFAAPMHFFDSCWEPDTNSTVAYINKGNNCTYPFGVDPEWAYKSNWLIFFNSFKMKNAVIFGLFQVTIGLLIATINCIFKKKYFNLFLDIIPKFLILFSTTGYMCFLIIYKWLVNWENRKGQEGGIKIIVTLIDLAFYLGKVEDENEFFNNQQVIQKVLLSIIIICIVIMWFIKPYLEYRLLKKKLRLWELGEIQQQNFEYTDAESFSFADLFVNQSILSIEFVLGILSNTASYTRLWALSLSHSELSAIFWDKLIMYPLSLHIPGLVAYGYLFWCFFTLFVLMMSEGLSAFLHTLRLHWIEFFSKFVDDENGIEFHPFSFKFSFKKLANQEDDDFEL